MRQRITLLCIDAGGGHRAAANALLEVFRLQRRPWDAGLVCIQDVFDQVDFIRRYTGIRFHEVYNIMLRRGWTAGSAQLIRLMHTVIRMSHQAQVEALRRHWRKARPDLVVSLIPHFNRAARQALDDVWPGVPYVTLLTDIADYPPHFWIEKLDQHVICGSARAAAQASDAGMPPDRILRTSGMVVHPRFYEPVVSDRGAERARLGLRPGLPTGLVLFGGEGSEEMVRIARALRRSPAQLQLIMLCGRNAKVAAELRSLETDVPMLVEGFTRDIPYYMELADFLIGKPGPGSISEALVKGLPVIVGRNRWTLAHERCNTDWLAEQGAGLVVPGIAGIADAVGTLLAPENYARFRRQAAATRNEAVFEIPALLETLLAGARREPSPLLAAV